MSIFRNYLASNGFIATLIAGAALVAVPDGASAKSGARLGHDKSTAHPIRNTIHPIVTDPAKPEHCKKSGCRVPVATTRPVRTIGY